MMEHHKIQMGHGMKMMEPQLIDGIEQLEFLVERVLIECQQRVNQNDGWGDHIVEKEVGMSWMERHSWTMEPIIRILNHDC